MAPRVIPPPIQRKSAPPATVDASYMQRKYEHKVEVTSKAFRHEVMEYYRNGCPTNFSSFGMCLMQMLQAYEESTRWIWPQRQHKFTQDEMDVAKHSFRVAEQSAAFQQLMHEKAGTDKGKGEE